MHAARTIKRTIQSLPHEKQLEWKRVFNRHMSGGKASMTLKQFLNTSRAVALKNDELGVVHYIVKKKKSGWPAPVRRFFTNRTVNRYCKGLVSPVYIREEVIGREGGEPCDLIWFSFDSKHSRRPRIFTLLKRGIDMYEAKDKRSVFVRVICADTNTKGKVCKATHVLRRIAASYKKISLHAVPSAFTFYYHIGFRFIDTQGCIPRPKGCTRNTPDKCCKPVSALVKAGRVKTGNGAMCLEFPRLPANRRVALMRDCMKQKRRERNQWNHFLPCLLPMVTRALRSLPPLRPPLTNRKKQTIIRRMVDNPILDSLMTSVQKFANTPRQTLTALMTGTMNLLLDSAMDNGFPMEFLGKGQRSVYTAEKSVRDFKSAVKPLMKALFPALKIDFSKFDLSHMVR